MVKILFFAGLKEQADKDQLEVEASGMTVSKMCEKYLADLNMSGLSQAMIAVNEEYADAETILQEGDTVAFIPPVSGG